jgi:hypothetical protein
MSLFKGKRNDESNGTSTEGGFKFNQVFTGEAFLTPIMFNPTGAQIKEIKNLPDSFEIREPEYIIEKTVDKNTGEKRTVRKISLLCSFDPNTMLPKPKAGETVVKYANKYFYNYSVLISSKIVHSRNADKGDKILVIDSKMNSAWIPCNVDKALELNEKLRKARKDGVEDEITDAQDDMTAFVKKAVKAAATAMGDVGYGAPSLHLDSVRACRDGEEVITKLIFDMTPLQAVYYMTKDAAKKLQKEDAKKYEARKQAYEDFDMSPAEEIFSMLLANDIDGVNKLIFEDNKEWFESDGQQCKFGVFLGARVADDGKVYQSHMGAYGNFIFGQQYTFKKQWKAVKAAVLKDYSAYGVTFMPKDMAKKITDPQYGYSDIWQDSFVFQPYTVEEFVPAQDVEVKTTSSNSGDDLPF